MPQLCQSATRVRQRTVDDRNHVPPIVNPSLGHAVPEADRHANSNRTTLTMLHGGLAMAQKEFDTERSSVGSR
jgi:hypothetical protein